MNFFFKNILTDFYHILKGNTLPNIKKIKSKIKINRIKKKKKILIATSAGGLKSQIVFETAISLGLLREGFDVEFLLCDEILKACIMTTHSNIAEEDLLVKEKIKDKCSRCFQPAYKYLLDAGFNVVKLGSYINKKETNYILKKNFNNFSIKDLASFTKDDINVGEHAYSGTLRYYAKTNLDEEKNGKKILIQYLKSALITKTSIENLFKHKNYDEIFLNHGIYVPQGIIIDVAKKNKIKSSTWCLGYRKKTFCLTRGDTYHRSLIYEKNSNWENFKFNHQAQKKILIYLRSRMTGKNDWIHFYKNKPNFDVSLYFKEKKIDVSKPLIGMATSVMWDAQIDFPTNFYNNCLDWVFDTINFFVKNQHLQLIIRISPAEVNEIKPARQRVYDEIKKKFTYLPKNIFIVRPEETISSYAILSRCNNIIIYGSRIGIEMAALGKPVIVCGEGFVRNKKIALDVNSRKNYHEILSSMPIPSKQMPKGYILRAQKYAYHFFFRRMIEIKFIQERRGKQPMWTMNNETSKFINKFKEDPGYQSIINSFLSGKDFIFKHEELDY
jgi:hypothetical protein